MGATTKSKRERESSYAQPIRPSKPIKIQTELAPLKREQKSTSKSIKEKVAANGVSFPKPRCERLAKVQVPRFPSSSKSSERRSPSTPRREGRTVLYAASRVVDRFVTENRKRLCDSNNDDRLAEARCVPTVVGVVEEYSGRSVEQGNTSAKPGCAVLWKRVGYFWQKTPQPAVPRRPSLLDPHACARWVVGSARARMTKISCLRVPDVDRGARPEEQSQRSGTRNATWCCCYGTEQASACDSVGCAVVSSRPARPGRGSENRVLKVPGPVTFASRRVRVTRPAATRRDGMGVHIRQSGTSAE